MATIRPFRGCRFNPETVGNLSSVICPPYDMIGPDLKTELQQRSPYNAVHLEGGEQPDPVNPQAGYQQAASLFQSWLADGILIREDVPCFYVMRHTYDFGGRRYQHRGLVTSVLVDDYDAGAVFPHEFTREPAVLDRVALLDACQAQFSPIMSLYRDAEGTLDQIFDSIVSESPDASGATPAGGDAQLWRVADSQTVSDINEAFANRPVFLADGHHRYEAALRYRRRQPGAQQEDGDAASNYVMMTLIEFDDPGLLLLPYHRVLGGLSPDQLKDVRDRMDEVFEARAFHPDITPQEAANEVARIGENTHCFGVFWSDAPPSIHTIRGGVDWEAWGQLAVSEAWVLQDKILAPVLGDALVEHIDYSPDHEGIAQRVNVGEKQAAILLKPFPLGPFREIVGAGNRLPPKSTFFYPKLPTGLVINQLSGSL